MPNDDYIKRSELIAHFSNFDPGWGLIEQREVVDDIRDFPAADVEPVRYWRWIEVDDDYAYAENVYRCSECGEEWDILEGTPLQNMYYYCPNCGAKMDEGQNHFRDVKKMVKEEKR